MGIPMGQRTVITDEYERPPYKSFGEGRTPMNQIHIRQGTAIRDMSEISMIVAGAEPFQICRAYDFSHDGGGGSTVRNIIRTQLAETDHGTP